MEVQLVWWSVVVVLIIHFLVDSSRRKMYHIFPLLLSFSSIFLLIAANDTLNILMPDVVAHHVRISFLKRIELNIRSFVCRSMIIYVHRLNSMRINRLT